jgi:hypothetical protein
MVIQWIKKIFIQWATGQTMICKTLHRKLKIEQYEPQSGVNSGALEELAVPVHTGNFPIILNVSKVKFETLCC